MDLEGVMGEIETALGGVDGLRIFKSGEKPTPPAAFITWPDTLDFDGTYGRGMDSLTLDVVVIVGRADARSTRTALAAYCAGSGASSIKAALESHTYTEADVVTVPGVQFDPYDIAAVTYVAATFSVNIVGRGA
jgi:hypothetical protein